MRLASLPMQRAGPAGLVAWIPRLCASTDQAPPCRTALVWSPLPGAVVGAVFWPLALFVAIEILARTAWPKGPAWKVVRLGGLLPVAVVAAVVSYRHLPV